MKRTLYKRSKLGPITLYRLGLGPLIGRMVLLLTTTGRRSGLPRVTPLQYERIDGVYYLGAALGRQADWVRNLLADPCVSLRVKNDTLSGRAEVIDDLDQIAAYLQYRLERHPRMVGLILRMDGLGPKPSPEELREYAGKLVIVKVTPDQA